MGVDDPCDNAECDEGDNDEEGSDSGEAHRRNRGLIKELVVRFARLWTVQRVIRSLVVKSRSCDAAALPVRKPLPASDKVTERPVNSVSLCEGCEQNGTPADTNRHTSFSIACASYGSACAVLLIPASVVGTT